MDTNTKGTKTDQERILKLLRSQLADTERVATIRTRAVEEAEHSLQVAREWKLHTDEVVASLKSEILEIENPDIMPLVNQILAEKPPHILNAGFQLAEAVNNLGYASYSSAEKILIRPLVNLALCSRTSALFEQVRALEPEQRRRLIEIIKPGATKEYPAVEDDVLNLTALCLEVLKV